MIICAGKSEQFDFAHPVGIGLIEAAVNLTRICELGKPEHIVFVGTAGSYGEKEIFDIVESRVAANVEQSFFEGNSYTPIDNVISSTEDVSRETVVNSSNYITTNKEIWEHYTAQNIHLENMEFYAVMKVAQMFGIPVAGIFIVTNYCDEQAHENFKKNHAEAMKRLTAYVKARAGQQ
jgi:nucleoside phosphorylase